MFRLIYLAFIRPAIEVADMVLAFTVGITIICVISGAWLGVFYYFNLLNDELSVVFYMLSFLLGILGLGFITGSHTGVQNFTMRCLPLGTVKKDDN